VLASPESFDFVNPLRPLGTLLASFESRGSIQWGEGIREEALLLDH
jgi:hypothetical protein